MTSIIDNYTSSHITNDPLCSLLEDPDITYAMHPHNKDIECFNPSLILCTLIILSKYNINYVFSNFFIEQESINGCIKNSSDDNSDDENG